MAEGRNIPEGREDQDDDDAVFVDGEVVDDLDGEDPEYGEDEDDDGHGVSESGDGESGPGDHTMVEDDSFHCFDAHQDAVMAVAWSPAHPDLVASGGCDDTAFIWRSGEDAYEETSGSMATLELLGHTDTVASLSFNSTGTLLATAGLDGQCNVWNARTGELVHALEGSGCSVEWVRWHPRGDVVLAGTEDFMAYMWNANTGAVMQVLSGHSGVVTAGMFTPDGKAIVTTGGEDDCSVRVWSPKTGECTHVIQDLHNFHAEGIICVAVKQDSATVITGGMDGTVKLCNIQSGRILGTLTGHGEAVEVVGFSGQLPLAASAGVDGQLLVWDLNTLSQRGACAHPEAVTRMAWHPTQPLVYTACLDGIARCWDLRTAACVHQYGGHTDAIQDIALSPDGSLLLTGSDDNTCRVFKTV